MAQKKVILQDGQNDLMPKTLASVVFTEDGTSVETALKNLGSGGGSSGGGTGNVKVTNASGLNKDNYYAFKPSANGSVEGTFQIIPAATASKAGLMSSENYSKLYDMKGIAKLPNSVMEYTSSTPSSTIEAALQTALSTDTAQNTAIMFAYISSSLSGSYNSAFPKFYIGDRECMMSGKGDTENATLELAYLADGGKLKTLVLNLVVDGETYTYSAEVLESRDDTYYLPKEVYTLGTSASRDDVINAIGDTEALKQAIATNKKIYIFTQYGMTQNCIPVTASSFSVIVDLSFLYYGIIGEENIRKKVWYNTSYGGCKWLYLEGYKLPASLYTLTSSSESDEISTAVGGESGLKAIIQAIKDGNRLVIRGTLDDFVGMTINQDVQCNMYQEADNGNIGLFLSGKGYGLWNSAGGLLSIQYTKSSNTFSCSVVTD